MGCRKRRKEFGSDRPGGRTGNRPRRPFQTTTSTVTSHGTQCFPTVPRVCSVAFSRPRRRKSHPINHFRFDVALAEIACSQAVWSGTVRKRRKNSRGHARHGPDTSDDVGPVSDVVVQERSNPFPGVFARVFRRIRTAGGVANPSNAFAQWRQQTGSGPPNRSPMIPNCEFRLSRVCSVAFSRQRHQKLHTGNHFRFDVAPAEIA